MKMSVFNPEGKEIEKIEVASEVFNAKVNEDLLGSIVINN